MYYKKFNIKLDSFTDIESSSSRATREAKRQDLQTNLTKTLNELQRKLYHIATSLLGEEAKQVFAIYTL